MRKDIEHLPEEKQHQLAHIVQAIREAFDAAVKAEKVPADSHPQIEKIILYGSYARGDWVEDRGEFSGYESDFDILVIVNDEALTRFDYWYRLEDRLWSDPKITVPTDVIVHDLADINYQLAEGRYFFSDIREEGIVLYELHPRALTHPKKLSPERRLEISEKFYDRVYTEAVEFFDDVTANMERKRYKKAAFMLHQLVEHLYGAVLLVRGHYRPKTHNIRQLRSMAEDMDRGLVAAWPERDRKPYRRWFDLLRRAYVEARYSEHYEIEEEALIWLSNCACELQRRVKASCDSHLSNLRQKLR